MPPPSLIKQSLWLPVLAAALGYSVDLYDIVLFGVVRVASLKDLGLNGAEATLWAIRLLNLQMLGMLLGGFFWGWIGDTRGRRTALFASIALYSAANLGNAFVTDVQGYAAMRLLAGIGLAGELGAGIALISELLPARQRGYAVSIVACLGLLGALTAAVSGSQLPWRQAYLLGGGLGAAVLLLRFIAQHESPLYLALAPGTLRSIRGIVASADVTQRFGRVFLLGVPIWVISALFVNLAPEFGRALGFATPIKVGEVLLWQASGSALGTVGFGLLSEFVRSRKKAFALALLLLAALTPLLLTRGSAAGWCAVMGAIGFVQGYWTIFVIVCAEQFATGLRATTATAIPNLVRGITIPATLGVQALAGSAGWPMAGAAFTGVAALAAAWALWGLPETWRQPL